MFRTDLHDNEGTPEWSYQAGSATDLPGDDDVLVTLNSSGAVTADYVPPLGLFETRTVAVNGRMRSKAVKVRSAKVAKWVDDADLWKEDYDEEEEHTIPPQRLLSQTGGAEHSLAPKRRCQNRSTRGIRRGLFGRRFR